MFTLMVLMLLFERGRDVLVGAGLSGNLRELRMLYRFARNSSGLLLVILILRHIGQFQGRHGLFRFRDRFVRLLCRMLVQERSGTFYTVTLERRYRHVVYVLL